MFTLILRVASGIAALWALRQILEMRDRAKRTCREGADSARLRCINWRVSMTRRCLDWERQQRQVCQQWEQQQERRCDRWEQQQERRCDRWEEERRRECASWHWLFRWLCLAFTWITTTVCRVWTWITTTVCRLWVWITTTVCRLWVWVTTFLCRLWVLVVNIVCTAWVLVLDIWCPIWCFLRRLGAPNEVSEARSECIYGWTAAFRITEAGECVLSVVVRIRLQPDVGISQQQLQTVRSTWETAIEQNWSDRFRIRRTNGDCQCQEFRVLLDVQWVTSGEHHSVRVRPGSGRADMANWFITSTGGTASHEVGHMLGNVDEYADPACPGRTVTSDNSIMQTSQRGQVRPRHYQRFADWASARTCCDYEVVDR